VGPPDDAPQLARPELLPEAPMPSSAPVSPPCPSAPLLLAGPVVPSTLPGDPSTELAGDPDGSPLAQPRTAAGSAAEKEVHTFIGRVPEAYRVRECGARSPEPN
jgi:hypothetical protein